MFAPFVTATTPPSLISLFRSTHTLAHVPAVSDKRSRIRTARHPGGWFQRAMAPSIGHALLRRGRWASGVPARPASVRTSAIRKLAKSGGGNRSEAPNKVGVIGCGYFSQNHMHAWEALAGVELGGICDVDPERVDETALRFGVPDDLCFTDAGAMLDAVGPGCVYCGTVARRRLRLRAAGGSRDADPACLHSPDWTLSTL